jgi:DNA-binding HxlR family transcriptional regulator
MYYSTSLRHICKQYTSDYKTIFLVVELEHEGLISRKMYPEIPPKVEYRMTPQAKELETIIKELGKWANRWKSPQLQKSKL